MTTSQTDLLVVDREVFNRYGVNIFCYKFIVILFFEKNRTLKSAHEKELQEKTEFINRSPLFSLWPPRLKRLVSLSLERTRYAYDSVLYKQGAPADAVYFIWK
jgi:hypothetical protein